MTSTSPRGRPGGLAAGVRHLVVAILMGACSMATEPVDSVSAAGDRPVATAPAAFPLRVAAGGRHLEDAEGRPFLIKGDTAWSLIAQLSREDAELYLEDRRARGFNTILVNLLEAFGSANPPANLFGDPPFHRDTAATLDPSDPPLPPEMQANYAAPNEAYFAHADWVLRRAAEKGLLVLLTPSYVGWGGGSQGWYRVMEANGPERLRRYGQFLGRRYGSFANILWVHAGDYDPPDKDLVRAIAEGIREVDPQALHTAHGAPQTAALDYWSGEPWLSVNTAYSYRDSEPVHSAVLAQYLRPDALPLFLIESGYENEHGATERDLRMQAYQAMLSGAAGQVFGNNPIWHFDGPGLYPAPYSWKEALSSRGTQSMTHLHRLFDSLAWWLLEPDSSGRLLVDGAGPDDERALAARAADGSFALIYLPSRRAATVDLGRLAGPEVAARWYDPAGGAFVTVDGAPFAAAGTRRFSPEPSTNSSGFEDWVLLLESRP